MEREQDPTEAAAQWFLTMRSGPVPPAQRARFAAWLAESPVHVREYLGIAETWGALLGGGSWPDLSADELIAAARGASRVVELGSAAAGAAASRPGGARLATRRVVSRVMAVALTVAAVALLVLWGAWLGDSRLEYSTARGEQRSVVLPDGSVVQLNTLSRVIVRFDQDARRVELPDGEAFFRVAHDPSRPFSVATPAARVQAIGTEFNVYVRDEGTEVAVVDGRVGVQPRKAKDRSAQVPEPIVLAAHEFVAVDASGRSGPILARSPDRILSWMQRRLVFEDERLDRVVAELNRYNAVRLRVLDDRLAGLRISGAFDTDDPGVLVKYLAHVKGVEVTRDRDTWLLGTTGRRAAD